MLDDNDKLILEYLMHDCRITTTQLAKITKLSQPSVVYRIKKLENEKYISKYDVLIDLNKFDIPLQFIFISVPHSKQKEFEKWCTQNESLMSVIRHIHKYNYSITALLTEKEKKELVKYLKTNNLEHLYYTSEKIIYLPFSIFDLNIPNTHINLTTDKLKLDNIDIKILKRLSNGGAKDSILELSKHTNLTVDLVLYRYKKLKKAGYLPLFLAQANLEKFHLQYDIIVFETKNSSFNDVTQKMNKIKKSIFLSKVKENKYLTTIMSKDFKEYKQTLSRLYEEFDENIIFLEEYMVKDWLFLNRLNLKKVL